MNNELFYSWDCGIIQWGGFEVCSVSFICVYFPSHYLPFWEGRMLQSLEDAKISVSSACRKGVE